jgi:type I site-specific restriction-modification system R (restriction) subunit
MREEREEGSIVIEEMDKPLEESEVGPTTSIDVTDEQLSTVEAPPAEHEVQEQNKQIERAQEESKISKSKQKRRITSYLSNISKQVEKQENQINKVTMMIQSLQMQKQTKSTTGTGESQFQSVKQIKSQVSLLQKQMARIQNDIQRIRAASIARTKTRPRTKFRKSSSSVTASVKPKIKKSKSFKSTKFKRGRNAQSRIR